MGFGYTFPDEDWPSSRKRLRQIIQKLSSLNLGPEAAPTFGGLTINGDLVISDLVPGRVMFTGTNGEVTDDGDFTFETDTLTVTKLAATTMTGNLDMNGNDIDDVGLVTITGIGNAAQLIIGNDSTVTSSVLTFKTIGDDGSLIYSASTDTLGWNKALTVAGIGTFEKIIVNDIDIDGLSIVRNDTGSFLVLRGQPTGNPAINIGAGDTISLNSANPILAVDLTMSGDLLVSAGDVFIGPTSSMLAPLNITGDTADIGDRHEGLWMRSKEGAWIVQLNVRGPRLEIGGGGNLDTTPAMSVNYNTGRVGIGTTTPTVPLSVLEKSGNTGIGGFAVKLTNKTGFDTVAGQLVIASAGTDDAFATAAISGDNVIGIVLDGGVADGSEEWIVISGIADVLIDAGGCLHGDRMISSATAGSADVWNVGGAVATHFLEIGHCIETRVGAGLARCILHFN